MYTSAWDQVRSCQKPHSRQFSISTCDERFVDLSGTEADLDMSGDLEHRLETYEQFRLGPKRRQLRTQPLLSAVVFVDFAVPSNVEFILRIDQGSNTHTIADKTQFAFTLYAATAAHAYHLIPSGHYL